MNEYVYVIVDYDEIFCGVYASYKKAVNALIERAYCFPHIDMKEILYWKELASDNGLFNKDGYSIGENGFIIYYHSYNIRQILLNTLVNIDDSNHIF